MVSLGHGLVLMGGNDGYTDQSSMYLLTCSEHNCFWTLMSQKLSTARNQFVAMLIPGEIAECNML